MFKSNLGILPTPPLELNEIGLPVDAPVIDQFYSQEFNLGENGFPMNDVEVFFHTESEELRQVIAQRLQEVKAQYPDQSLSDEVLCSMVIPRNVQSYHDLREFGAQLKHDGLEKCIENWKAEKASKEVIQFEKQDVSDMVEES